MRRKVIVGLLVLVAALAMAVVERERPFLPEPRDEAEARRLNALARVILITLDGPVRDDVLTGPQLVGLQRVIERSGVVLRATTT